MGDLITILQIIQKLNNKGLVLDTQVEHISEELLERLQEIINPEAWELLQKSLQTNISGHLNLY